MKKMTIYVIVFDSPYEEGVIQASLYSFTNEKKAEEEAARLIACGHNNVKVLRTILPL